MKHPTLILIFITNLICATCSNATAQTTVQLDSTILTVDTIITGLDVPWELLWGPDNHLWLTERNGKISRVNPTNGQRKIILDHSSSVYQFYESGMLGLFLHPEFASKPFVYVAYTYLNNSTVKERISRFTYSLDSLTNEEVLVENIPGNTTHIGCRFLLLPDQTLIFTTGDARKDQDAQNPALLNGKVMRMKLDGSIPADNPIANSYVWSWGLRNTQGLALGPNNIIYGSEHGPTSDDELNILEIGRNYGWPNVEGMCNSAPELQFCQDSNVVEPIFTWTPTIAPSDLIYYQHASIPELNNTLVMTVLKDKRLIAFTLSADGKGVLSTQNYLTNAFGRIRDICTDGQGTIFLATNGKDWSNSDPNTHTILRLRNLDFTSVLKPELEQMVLYPNPSHQPSFTLSSAAPTKAQLNIYDAQGRLIDQVDQENSTRTLKYQNDKLTAGTYFIQVHNGVYRQSLRWVVLPY